VDVSENLKRATERIKKTTTQKMSRTLIPFLCFSVPLLASLKKSIQKALTKLKRFLKVSMNSSALPKGEFLPFFDILSRGTTR
jgi:hypothetical protein